MKTVYIIIAFCAGLFLGHLFFPSESQIKPPNITELSKEKQEFAHIDTVFSYQQFVDQKLTDSLSKEIKSYKYLLSNARLELSGKREKTFALVNKIKHDTIFHSDTLLVDSLQQRIALVNQATDDIFFHYHRSDSLLERMVAIRDTQLILCNRSFAEIKNLAQEQLQREQKLSNDLNTALKQQKQKRLQNKVLAAGMLFFSGIATTLYIKSKP